MIVSDKLFVAPYKHNLLSGVWISPFYPSSMKDFGYDVSDFKDVDPIFGDLAELRLLVRGHSHY